MSPFEFIVVQFAVPFLQWLGGTLGAGFGITLAYRRLREIHRQTK